MASFLGNPKIQYFKTGTVDYLSGGKLYSYDAGTTTPRYTYPTIADALAGTNPNTNPVVLDSRGEANVVVNGATKLILKDASDNIIWTVDNVDQSSIDVFDSNGNALLRFVQTADAVNEVTITNAATTDNPRIDATGGDLNVGLEISSKAAGNLYLDGGATGTVEVGTTSTGDINLRRAVTAHSTLTVTNTTTINGNMTTNGALAVNGHVTTASNVQTSFLPAGVVVWKASTTVPTGWLECAGAAISRTTYSNLFADIGTTYGAGDGSTTFNLPNLARRTIVGRGGSGTGTLAATVGSTGGAETHTLVVSELANHYHDTAIQTTAVLNGAGAPSTVMTTGGTTSTSTTGSNSAHNNMQPSIVLMAIIRAY